MSETKDIDADGMNIIINQQRLSDNDPPPMEDKVEKSYEDDHAFWKICILDFVNGKLLAGIMILLTIYALFGDDIRLSASEKPDDDIFFTISCIALFFFTLELVLNMLAKPGYLLGFYFWLDLLSTISLIPDIGWIWGPLVGEETTAGAQTAALKGAKGARAGTKAGRAVRIVRLVRMVRIVKLYKMTAGDENVDVEDSGAEPSKVGKKLTELTTRRVIIITLGMILILPLLDQSVFKDDYDSYQDHGLSDLHRLTSPYYNYTVTGANRSTVSLPQLKGKIIEYVRNSGKLMYLDLCGQHNLVPEGQVLSDADWIKNMKFQATLDGQYTESINPDTLFNPAFHLHGKKDIQKRFRPAEVNHVSAQQHYIRDELNRLYQTSVKEPCVSEAYFYLKDATASRASLSLGKTFFVMFVLTCGVMLFTNDAATLVIEPIERMMATVTKLAENPLEATDGKRVQTEDEKNANDSGFETMLLEKTLKKIGGLLQVGFGSAGAEIIGNNMGTEGEMDAMVPGKLITSVFGFCIIEDFTETCSYLGADITRYINTVAAIAHGNVHRYFGAANKNIGCAFLMAWKICDGRLFGLKDPRDEDQTQVGKEALQKGRAGVVVRGKGFGTAERDLTPEELVDASLSAFLKSHYDVHNANLKGGQFQEFNTTLQTMAANGSMHKDDVAKFEHFNIHMGFGMHIGWAIEGAIGSKYKIDASYLSPNVNMSARLEAATHQFGTSILVSEWFYNELSASAKHSCRMVDRICVVGSKVPMEIWTVDVFNYEISNFLVPEIEQNGKQKLADWGTHAHFRLMQQGVKDGWREAFDAGVQSYLSGDWSASIASLNRAENLYGQGKKRDGPTKSLLDQMAARGNEAPSDWIVEGQTRGYRQLTSK